MNIRSEDEVKEGLFAALTTRTEVSDVREAGVLAQMIPAFARDLARAQVEQLGVRDTFFRTSAEGADLDARGREVLPDPMDRAGAKYAVGGALVFGRNVATTAAVVIPVGTPVVRSADNFRGTTLVETTIPSNALDAAAVPCVASRRGTIGNCWASDYDTLGSSIQGCDRVRNTAAIQNGVDREEDDAYSQRQIDWTKGIGGVTPQALINVAMAVDDPTWGRVTTAAISSPSQATRGLATLWIDNGTGTCDVPVNIGAGEVLLAEAAGGEQDLYLLNRPVQISPTIDVTPSGGSPSYVMTTQLRPWGKVRLWTPLVAGDAVTARAYTAYAGLVRVVQDAVNGAVTSPADGPGYMGAGDIVEVAPASLYGGALLSIGISMVLMPGLADPTGALDRIRGAVVATVNGTGIAQGCYRGNIVALVKSLGTVLNVTRVTFNNLDADIHAGQGQVVRTSDANVDVR